MKHVGLAAICALLIGSLLAGIGLATQPVSASHSPVKNLILMIGDGMGPTHLALLEMYAAANQQRTAFQQLASESHTHLSITGAHQALVVDSACSASQLATGKNCNSETLGLDIHNRPALTLVERARALGKSTGLVSDTRITHATPAAFAAHQLHRSMEAEAAMDMLNNQVDVLFSGGLSFFLPNNTQQITPDLAQQIQRAGMSLTSKRTDDLNLLEQAQQQGYQLAFTAQQLAQQQHLPVLGLFQNSVMPDAISIRQQQRIPTLKAMTEKALELLDSNPEGFFLMVEAGQIDWTAHNNDAGALLHEMLQFDEVLASVLAWLEGRNDTLLVVTADHETGGFGFSYQSQQNPQLKAQQPLDFISPEVLSKLHQQSKGSYAILADTRRHNSDIHQQAQFFAAEVAQHMGINLTPAQAQEILTQNFAEYDAFFPYVAEKPLNKLAAFSASERGIVWSTGTHTTTPVPVFIRYPSSFASAQTTGKKIPPLRGILTHPQLGQFMHSVWSFADSENLAD